MKNMKALFPAENLLNLCKYSQTFITLNASDRDLVTMYIMMIKVCNSLEKDYWDRFQAAKEHRHPAAKGLNPKHNQDLQATDVSVTRQHIRDIYRCSVRHTFGMMQNSLIITRVTMMYQLRPLITVLDPTCLPEAMQDVPFFGREFLAKIFVQVTHEYEERSFGSIVTALIMPAAEQANTSYVRRC